MTIASTDDAVRVLETSSPPTIYIPPADVLTDHLRATGGTTYCEWKGDAAYYDIVVGEHVAQRAAWTYPNPKPEFASIQDFVSFYPGRVDVCYLGDEPVHPQPGNYYGGWVTADIVGPFKGERGTEGW